MKTRDQLWSYDTSLSSDMSRCTGYDVHATDGDIGSIDESSNAVGRSSLVVDTGKWIFGKKRLVPAAAVTGIDHNQRKVFVSLTKDQVKNAPDYDAARRSDNDYYDRHADYYGGFFL